MRASQRAPMSFVALGAVSASPNFSGTGAGTFNFLPSGLSGYSLNPRASRMVQIRKSAIKFGLVQPISRRLAWRRNSPRTGR
jgi:hypothetical protein